MTIRAESRQLTICLNIAPMSAAAFYRLNNRVHRRQNVQCFSLIIFIIIEELARRAETKTACSELNALTKLTMNQVLEKLFKEFHDLKEAFDRSKVFQFPSHKLYDHKIELKDNQFQMSKSRVYQMSTSKLMKTKKYLEKNFKKKFISLSTTFYVLSIFFAAKFNESFRFCVDYRKLNVIIKKNRYSISFIKETLVKIMSCKYLTKLNIIAAFNKLHMHSNNKNLIIFIIFMRVYKYHILFFDFTNESTSYQHYMNNVLFEYLNDFAQAYFDNVFIYNKTRKEHIEHVRKILKKFIDVDLQMNIKKCEFYVQKINFLNVFLFIENIRIDFLKIQMIFAWITSTCLKEVQAFVDFYNFYRRFIRNFFKIVRLMFKLTQKDIFFSWSEAYQKSFESLKKAITQTSILRHFDKFKKVILKTDSSDYVNEGVLSQYDDEDNLYSMIFYNRNFLLAECNYEIYDKKLLIIVRCLKHWRFDLKTIEIFIKIFIDHKNLKYFMINKELIRC